jgi:putative ABC transport system ATP-binding protein
MTLAASVQSVTKRYQMDGEVVNALRDVSLEVPEGDYVAIMGASGSGKSTFMNILGCLDRPTGGKYILEGKDVSGLSRDELAQIRNKKIGFVFQNFNLLGRTSAENVNAPFHNKCPSWERHQRPRGHQAFRGGNTIFTGLRGTTAGVILPGRW